MIFGYHKAIIFLPIRNYPFQIKYGKSRKYLIINERLDRRGYACKNLVYVTCGKSFILENGALDEYPSQMGADKRSSHFTMITFQPPRDDFHCFVRYFMQGADGGFVA